MIIPAIDLIDGNVVRLYQGRYDNTTEYAFRAINLRNQYAQAGADWQPGQGAWTLGMSVRLTPGYASRTSESELNEVADEPFVSRAIILVIVALGIALLLWDQVVQPHLPSLDLQTLIARFGLQGYLQQRCSSLSGGQRQSLLLALALLGQPKILFLDEPTVGMDVEARQRFWQLIRTARAEGLCILLTTHYLEEADALADRILLLKDGQFIADTSPTALKAGLSQRQIRCRSSLPLDAQQQLPGVSAVLPRNGRSCCTMTNSMKLTAWRTRMSLKGGRGLRLLKDQNHQVVSFMNCTSRFGSARTEASLS